MVIVGPYIVATGCTLGVQGDVSACLLSYVDLSMELLDDPLVYAQLCGELDVNDYQVRANMTGGSRDKLK